MSSPHSLSYSETLAQLYPRTNGGIKLGLENTQKLLDAVGNPEKGIPFVVVAGTNGKGSTSSLLAHALNTAGYKTGLYTSPHLLRFTERIRIEGNEVSQESVIRHYEAVQQVEEACDYPPTFFECVTAMTLLEFQAQQVDIGVLEVGLGGRLDSTNVVEKLLSIITPIGLDHQQFLGDTLSQIATEKAGIIPPKGNVVSADQIQEAEETLSRIIEERGASRYPLQPEVSQATVPPFQKMNIRVAHSAVQALGQLGFPAAPNHFEKAVESWEWPGRYHLISNHPPILLDGAHNPHALKALFRAIESDPAFAGKPIHTVVSTLRTKSTRDMLELIQAKSATLHLCPTSVNRSLSVAELNELALERSHVYASPEQALEAALSRADKNGLILITGSLFLVADVLYQLEGKHRDPPIAS